MTTFTVRATDCPSCETTFPIDPHRVPDEGVHARCSVCWRVFFVNPASELPVFSPEPESLQPEEATGPDGDPDDLPVEAVAPPHSGPESDAAEVPASSELLGDDDLLPADQPPPEDATPMEEDPSEAGWPDERSPSGPEEGPELENLPAVEAGPEESSEEGLDPAAGLENLGLDEVLPPGPEREQSSPHDEALPSWPLPGVESTGPREVGPDADIPVEATGPSEAAPDPSEAGGDVPDPRADSFESAGGPDREEDPPHEPVEHGGEGSAPLTELEETPGETPAPAPPEPVDQGMVAPGEEAREEGRTRGRALFSRRDPHERARRLARVLVSDMIVYHSDRHQRALRDGTLRQEFDEEIEKSWEQYVQQVGPEMAEETDYFREALNDLLARGEAVF